MAKKAVAPREGAWIEIQLQSKSLQLNMSRPVRARGLKYQ